MSTSDLKAEFGCTYVRAVAHAAGFFVQESQRMLDADGIDLEIFARGARGIVRSPRISLQVKATARRPTEDPFPFDLDVKNYTELIDETLQIPRILVIVVIPEDAGSWLSATEEELTMRRCAYWKTLRGQPRVENRSQRRVHIARSDTFHVTQLAAIMGRVGAGQLP